MHPNIYIRCGVWLDVILTRYLVDLCIHLPTVSDCALSLLPYLFFTMRHLILPDRSKIGGISTGIRSIWRYLRSQQLLTCLSWLTSQLLISSQPTKQPWLTSSTDSFRYTWPESADLHFHQGLTWSVDPFAAKFIVLKDSQGWPSTILHGCGFVRDMHRRYLPFCFQSLLMIYFCFSQFCVTNQPLDGILPP